MNLVQAAGYRIAFDRKGNGQPIVFLHGYVGDARDWRRTLDALSDEFTWIAWNAPGFAGSSDPPESFSLAGYADCLAAFVAELNLGRPHVVGLSFGGALALELCHFSCTTE